MWDFILKYWLEAVFGLAVAGLSFLYRKLSGRVKRFEAIGNGVQALLRDRIIQAYNNYQEKGFCPIYARDNVEKMYQEYHALGGNGTITELVERINELPTELKEDHHE